MSAEMSLPDLGWTAGDEAAFAPLAAEGLTPGREGQEIHQGYRVRRPARGRHA